MCDPGTAVALGVGMIGGAYASSKMDDGDSKDNSEENKNDDDEEVEESEDPARTKPLRPEPKTAQVRIADTRSLKKVASERENSDFINQNSSFGESFNNLTNSAKEAYGIIRKKPVDRDLL